MEKTTQTERTLLAQYVHERTQEYVQPTREGTPRGEPIGFSSVKYGAGLYALMNTKQKEIAESMEISHGLLRKWHTEQPFKDAVEIHCQRVSDLFIGNMPDRIKRSKALYDAYVAQGLNEMASQDRPSLGYFEVSDAGYYSDKLRDYILLALIIESEQAIKNRDIDMNVEIYSMLNVLRYSRKKKIPAAIKKVEEDTRKLLVKSIIDEGIETLLKPNFIEEDKKELVITFKIISKEFE